MSDDAGGNRNDSSNSRDRRAEGDLPGARAARAYRALLRVYPARFRREYGLDMEREFQLDLAEVGSRSSRLRVWLRALFDLALTVPREYWDSLTRGRGPRASAIAPGGGEYTTKRRWEMRGFTQDVQRAARALRRSPSFTAVAVLTLALGIGATTVIYSVVHGVLLAPLPYPDPARVVNLGEAFEDSPDQLAAVSYANALDWKAAQSTLEAIALNRGGALTLRRPEGAEQLAALFVDAEFFDILGARALRGRLFGGEENRVPGGHHIAVLTHVGWQRLFGEADDVVGAVLDLSGTPFTVIGVLSADFRSPFGGITGPTNDVIVPAMMIGQIDPQGNDVLTERRRRTFGAIGKLRPGVSAEQADADIKQVAARLVEQYPINNGMTASVARLTQITTAGIRGPALTLLGGAVVLLVIAVFGVTNLLLVRGASRSHELAVQIALGAGRRRVFRLLSVESALLALAGGTIGVTAAYAALPPLLDLVPTQLPPTADVTIGVPVLIMAFVATVAAGLGSGLVPALRLSAGAVNRALSGATRTVGDRAGQRVRGGLVLFEIATATILLASSALLIRSFLELRSVETGFETENVLTMQLNLPAAAYAADAAMGSAAERLNERIEALPGVEWAQAWGPGRPGLVFSFQTSVPDEMVIDQISEAPLSRRHGVGVGALEAMGLTLLRGRAFTETDDLNAPYVAIVSQSMANELWPGEDPIGKRYHNFQPPGGTSPANRHWTVVGVVSDAEHGGRVPFPGSITTGNDSYYPFAQRPERAFTLLVKTAGEPAAGPIREAIREFDPNIPIVQVATMAENLIQEEGTPRFAAQLMAGFGLAALLLAALGVYGVLSFTVAQREREIGLRAALGAERSDTLRHFLRYGTGLALAGAALGAISAWAAARGLQAVVPNVPDMDATAVAIAATLLVLVALLSCLIPALRATRIAPIVALKGE